MSTVRMLKVAAKIEGGKLMAAELVCPDCSAPGKQTGSYGGFEAMHRFLAALGMTKWWRDNLRRG